MSYVWGIRLTWWQIYYAIGDGQWYLFSNQMLQLVKTQITFGSIVLFLCWIRLKSVRFLLEAIFEPDNQKCYFQTQSYIGISSKQCIVYCLTDVFRYVSIYRYIDSPLIKTMWYYWIIVQLIYPLFQFTATFALTLRLVDLIATATDFEISMGFKTLWRAHFWQSKYWMIIEKKKRTIS